jgi:hypothetical protein
MPLQRVSRYRWHLLDAVQLMAIVLVVLALAPALSHLFSLTTRLHLSAPDFMVVQRLDHSLGLIGVLGLLALAGIGVHSFLVRRNAAAFAWSIVAVSGLAAAQIVFWSIAFPVSALTSGWTAVPDDFEAARQHWEYAIATVGVLSFGALLAVVRAVEASRPIASLSILESIERDVAVRAARERARALDAEKTPVQRHIAA